jgi:spore coat protein A
MVPTLAPPLAPFADALPLPQRLVATKRNGELTVPVRTGKHRFHRDLPESAIWGYCGTVPGPTIEAERGQPVTVHWRNELEGMLPVVVTTAPMAADADGVPVQCLPGLSGGQPDPNAGALSGHTVVHLHGALTPAAYDGWTGNLFAPGQSAVFHYPMDQRAALLWYHDHVMGVTRFGVYAGLAGLWIVRDERERELGLPERPPFEVPLLIQDRNFGLEDSGRLTGQLVHKTDPEVMEAFPPFTVVNGKVWPLLEVQQAAYRFRVLNGSNARTYWLVLLRDGEPELHRITQIGTDHGLLRTPARVPPDGLVLASAEHADLLIDFSDLEPGSELTLLNTAAAPFDGSAFPAAEAERAADPGRMLPYPHVMRFRVIPGPGVRRTIPGELASHYHPPAPRAGRRATPRHRARRTRTRRRAQHAHHARASHRRRRLHRARRHHHRRAADHSLPGRRRPLRRRHNPDRGIEDLAITAAISIEPNPDKQPGHVIDDNERVLKAPSGSTPTRSPKSPSASLPTAAAICTTATSSNTKTAT